MRVVVLAPARKDPFVQFVVSTSLVALAEVGDKTQVATVMLAARYDALATVVLATTLGMLIANAPVVRLGGALSSRLPLRGIRIAAAALFAILGLAVLVGK